MTEPTPRRYKNPPIETAVCEFLFEDGSARWDATLPGMFYAHIQEDYPEQQQEGSIEAEFSNAAGGPGQLSVRQALTGVRFTTPGGQAAVAIGPNSLRVYANRPYSSWASDFRPRIQAATRHFESVRPNTRVRRIGLRYVNQFTVASAGVTGDYVEGLPALIPGLPTTLRSFGHRTEHDFGDGTVLLYTVACPASDDPRVILDIDLVKDPVSPPVSFEEALVLTEDSKQKLRSVFESLITDNARRLFDADA